MDMKKENVIIVQGITKKYKLYENAKERLFDLIFPKKYGEYFNALTNVDFTANKGEVIGFIGTNGSGKSTLSNIIAGIVPETSGIVKVNGEVSLIAVAAGLKNDLTGRENIELKLLMLGFNKREIMEIEPFIIEFSELDKFIDQPVKSYSSGMRSRLGFSISVNVNPDILIIDEALSVGDKAFAEKSLNKMKEFKEQGKTMIFVSHSIGQMKQFCDKILWLEFGMVKEYGLVDEVIPRYEDFLRKWQVMNKEERNSYQKATIQNKKVMLSGSNSIINVNVDDYYNKKTSNEYVEKPISVLGHIRSGKSFIYKSPQQFTDAKSSEAFQGAVYYIKKQAVYNDERFFLLSEKPSAIEGVIGWMRASDLTAHRHVFVDNDPKEFRISGTGNGFNLPWGGEKNCTYKSLYVFSNSEFMVSETNLIGNNVWYKGKIMNENQDVWIHQNHLEVSY